MKQFLFILLFCWATIFVAVAGGNGNVVTYIGSTPVISQEKVSLRPASPNPKWIDKILEKKAVKWALKTLQDIDYTKKLATNSLMCGFGATVLYFMNMIMSVLQISAASIPIMMALSSMTALVLSIMAITYGHSSLKRYRNQENQEGIGAAIVGSSIGYFWVGLTIVAISIILIILGLAL